MIKQDKCRPKKKKKLPYTKPWHIYYKWSEGAAVTLRFSYLLIGAWNLSPDWLIAQGCNCAVCLSFGQH